MGNHYSARRFIEAIPGSAGIIAVIAKRVGCEWHTAKKYIERLPSVKRAYEDECENTLDLGEAKLIEAVRNGEPWAVKYLLSTKGRKRGYVERQERETVGPIEVRWIESDSDAKQAGDRTELLPAPGAVDISP